MYGWEFGQGLGKGGEWEFGARIQYTQHFRKDANFRGVEGENKSLGNDWRGGGFPL